MGKHKNARKNPPPPYVSKHHIGSFMDMYCPECARLERLEKLMSKGIKITKTHRILTRLHFRCKSCTIMLGEGHLKEHVFFYEGKTYCEECYHKVAGIIIPPDYSMLGEQEDNPNTKYGGYYRT